LRDGCAGADIVISQIDAHARCSAPLVIDKSDLSREGAIAITMNPHGEGIKTVRSTSGQRPWTAPNISGSAPPVVPGP
jgi:hypothetical protein